MSIMSSIRSAVAWLSKLEEALDYDIHSYHSDRLASVEQELQRLMKKVESPHFASQSSASTPFPAEQNARSVQ
jgi:hypothetical protein